MNHKTNRYDALIGKKYGMITVLEILEPNQTKYGKHRMCKCLCDCGEENFKRCWEVEKGQISSCGCKKGHYTHGLTNNSLYRVWSGMRTRCYNKREKAYKRYGGRGIKMCQRWLSDFINFYNDMSPTYKKGLSIDRIDTNGDYCPENCRWVDCHTQNNNQRSNILFEINGVVKSVGIWAKELGLTRNAMYLRVKRGWSAEEILATPFGEEKKKYVL